MIRSRSDDQIQTDAPAGIYKELGGMEVMGSLCPRVAGIVGEWILAEGGCVMGRESKSKLFFIFISSHFLKIQTLIQMISFFAFYFRLQYQSRLITLLTRLVPLSSPRNVPEAELCDVPISSCTLPN